MAECIQSKELHRSVSDNEMNGEEQEAQLRATVLISHPNDISKETFDGNTERQSRVSNIEDENIVKLVPDKQQNQILNEPDVSNNNAFSVSGSDVSCSSPERVDTKLSKNTVQLCEKSDLVSPVKWYGERLRPGSHHTNPAVATAAMAAPSFAFGFNPKTQPETSRDKQGVSELAAMMLPTGAPDLPSDRRSETLSDVLESVHYAVQLDKSADAVAKLDAKTANVEHGGEARHRDRSGKPRDQKKSKQGKKHKGNKMDKHEGKDENSRTKPAATKTHKRASHTPPPLKNKHSKDKRSPTTTKLAADPKPLETLSIVSLADIGLPGEFTITCAGGYRQVTSRKSTGTEQVPREEMLQSAVSFGSHQDQPQDPQTVSFGRHQDQPQDPQTVSFGRHQDQPQDPQTVSFGRHQDQPQDPQTPNAAEWDTTQGLQHSRPSSRTREDSPHSLQHSQSDTATEGELVTEQLRGRTEQRSVQHTLTLSQPPASTEQGKLLEVYSRRSFEARQRISKQMPPSQSSAVTDWSTLPEAQLMQSCLRTEEQSVNQMFPGENSPPKEQRASPELHGSQQSPSCSQQPSSCSQQPSSRSQQPSSCSQQPEEMQSSRMASAIAQDSPPEQSLVPQPCSASHRNIAEGSEQSQVSSASGQRIVEGFEQSQSSSASGQRIVEGFEQSQLSSASRQDINEGSEQSQFSSISGQSRVEGSEQSQPSSASHQNTAESSEPSQSSSASGQRIVEGFEQSRVSSASGQRTVEGFEKSQFSSTSRERTAEGSEQSQSSSAFGQRIVEGFEQSQVSSTSGQRIVEGFEQSQVSSTSRQDVAEDLEQSQTQASTRRTGPRRPQTPTATAPPGSNEGQSGPSRTSQAEDGQISAARSNPPEAGLRCGQLQLRGGGRLDLWPSPSCSLYDLCVDLRAGAVDMDDVRDIPQRTSADAHVQHVRLPREIRGASDLHYSNGVRHFRAAWGDAAIASLPPQLRSILDRRLMEELSGNHTWGGQQARVCIVCRDRAVNVQLFNCHHRVLCLVCLLQHSIQRCPWRRCRSHIEYYWRFGPL